LKSGLSYSQGFTVGSAYKAILHWGHFVEVAHRGVTVQRGHPTESWFHRSCATGAAMPSAHSQWMGFGKASLWIVIDGAHKKFSFNNFTGLYLFWTTD
jgi:hypothetical protein